MIAIIEIGGKQYTVEKGMSLIVDRQHADVGSTIETAPLLVATEKDVKVWTPRVEGSKVVLTVDEHLRGDKVRVFKIKAKKRYVRTQGFRAAQTRVTVSSIA